MPIPTHTIETQNSSTKILKTQEGNNWPNQ